MTANTTKFVSFIFNINNVETIRRIEVDMLYPLKAQQTIIDYVNNNIIDKEFIIPKNNEINIRVYRIIGYDNHDIVTTLVFEKIYYYTSKLELFAQSLIPTLESQVEDQFNEGNSEGEPYKGTHSQIINDLLHDFDMLDFMNSVTIPNDYIDESWYLERKEMIKACEFHSEDPTEDDGKNGFIEYVERYLTDHLLSKEFEITIKKWVDNNQKN